LKNPKFNNEMSDFVSVQTLLSYDTLT
jgi:hypothetical protein